MRNVFSSIGILICFLMFGAVAQAQRSIVEDTHTKAILASEVSVIGANDVTWLALHYEPIEGWHTYWKNPGDSGMPTNINWELPNGFKAGETVYPVPEPLPVGPLTNYGYNGSSTLLIPIQTPQIITANSIRIKATAEWLICEVECVPQYGEFELELPVGEQSASAENASLFANARQNMPDPAFWDASIEIAPEAAKLMVYMSADEIETIQNAYYFPAYEGVLDYAAAQIVNVSDDGLELNLKRLKGSLSPESGSGILKLELPNGEITAVNIDPALNIVDAIQIAAPTVPAAVPASEGLPVWQAALFALLGGIILNLMPCVFPVLSLKAFSFLSAGGMSKSARKREGWAYTFGILASFGVIVGILLALRAGGSVVGWGFQLQEPIFVAFMVLLMVLVSLSLAGMFNIQTGFEGAGQSLAAQEGTKGAFFTGVLATLVATPCTAPFMAPAIGYALTQPIYVALLVFFMLGFGLALPFLILSYSDRIAKALPRPGAWMETFKQGLAFPMLATAAWLLFVFNNEAGSIAMLFLIFAIIAVVFAIWLWQQGNGKILRTVSGAIGLLSIVSIFWNVEPIHEGSGSETAVKSSDSVFANSGIYSNAALDDLTVEGKPVFAYFTADWCITCKVNERVALNRAETIKLFDDKGITVLKGDYTNRDAEIAGVLAKYQRAGVPLYLYFPKGQKEAIVLPEVLTTGLLKDMVTSNPI
ncbi:protein-disulfide reductase DsbD [Kordiimonas sp. SCSIO 12610]|uniref:protein-disulfide reductase DsbD family protein n=1 Tax=Kordiimonas sp. SCSIO 12610 TaxID=2829597 RepID=UPI00210E704B|nr:protein-disulfide reductase DsbD domain-containing protein [Kordiimonas sp. SCSIO 12610]UTW53916.1 thioredoxin family protein [Kordiimonas sp. SCSIO 12610]